MFIPVTARDGRIFKYVNDQTGEEVHLTDDSGMSAPSQGGTSGYAPSDQEPGAEPPPMQEPSSGPSSVDMARAALGAMPGIGGAVINGLSSAAGAIQREEAAPPPDASAPGDIGSYGDLVSPAPELARRTGPTIPDIRDTSYGAQPLRPEQLAANATYDDEGEVVAQLQEQRAPLLEAQAESAGQIVPALGATVRRTAERIPNEAAFVADQRQKLVQSQDRLRQAVAQGIDPGRLFSSGAVSRVQAGIAGMASALWGNGGAGDPMVVLQKIIDRDIDAQKSALGQAQNEVENSLAAFTRAFGNQEQGEAAYRISLLDFAQVQADALAKRIGTVDAMEKAQRTRLQLEHEKQMTTVGFIDKAIDNQIKVNSGDADRDVARARLSLDAQKMLADKEGELNEPKWTGFEKPQTRWATADLALRATGNLRELREKAGRDNPGRGWFDSLKVNIPGAHDEAGKKYDRLVKFAIKSYQNTMSGQQSSDAEFNNIRSMIDSRFEADHIAGMEALEEATQLALRSAETIMGPERVAWLRKNAELVASSPDYDPSGSKKQVR